MARPATPAQGDPAFLACLDSEFQQGLVNGGLYQEFRGRWATTAYGGPNALNPDARADMIIRDMRAQATEDRRRALLQWSATRRIAEAMRSYVNRKGQADVGEFALELLYSVRSGESSVEGRAEALFADFQTDLAQFFIRFRRSDRFGTERHRAELADVLRELDGQQTNNPAAAAMAQAWQQTADRARRLYNAAGGSIPVLDRWMMPQVHNPARISHAGEAEWTAFVTQRIDPARMIDSRTGQPINPADIPDALAHVYRTITTQGLGETEAQLRGGGQGTLALQRLDHRFLVFRDADVWMEYQRRFGSGTIMDVMFNHLRSMSKDISAMQELGPNPGATIGWLEQTIAREARLAVDGDPGAIFPPENGRGKSFDDLENPHQGRMDYANAKIHTLRNLWDLYTGAAFVEGNIHVANAVGTMKNVFLANALGASTPLLAMTDHVTAAVARGYAGLPWWRTFADYARAALPGGREEALELGILSESALNTFMTEMRFLGPVFQGMSGKGWSRWLTERSMTASLLKPHTAAMKNAWGLTFLRHLHAMSGRTWGDLDAGFRNYLERYGLVAADWDAIRSTPARQTQRGLDVIHHRDVANYNGPAPAVRPRAGLTARQELALRMLEMLRGDTEAAVPSGTLRTQGWTTAGGKLNPGTMAGPIPAGAIWTSISSLKSYAFSVTQLHYYRMFELLRRQGLAPAAFYGAMLITGGTTLGLFIQMANELRAGREPQDPFSLDAWKTAAMKGAALGVLADPLTYGESSDGKDLAYALMGPLYDQMMTAYAAGSTAVDETGAWMTGTTRIDDKTGAEKGPEAGRNAVKLLKKLAPFTNLWYDQLAVERLVYDNLQRLADPDADAAFERRRQWYEDNKGQQYWWAPGQPAPEGMR